MFVIQINQWMLCKEVMAVCGQNRAEHIDTPCGRSAEFLGLSLAVHRVMTDLSRVNIVL